MKEKLMDLFETSESAQIFVEDCKKSFFSNIRSLKEEIAKCEKMVERLQTDITNITRELPETREDLKEINLALIENKKAMIDAFNLAILHYSVELKFVQANLDMLNAL